MYKNSIQTESFDLIAANYAAAIAWMAGLGIELQHGRTQHYDKVLQHWKDAYQTAPAEEGQRVYPDFVSAMFEIHDFVRVYTAFKDVPAAALTHIVDKLRRAVTGPIHRVDETPASTAARNFLFEAATMAVGHQPALGLRALLDAPDAGFAFQSRNVWIECKRIGSVSAIEENVRKASRQLTGPLSRPGLGHRGLVALDVSKVINCGDSIYMADDDQQLLAIVNRMMNGFIIEHSPIWESIYERRHRKLIGTLIRFAFMATSRQRNLLVYASQWAVNPRAGCSASDEQLLEDLVGALQAAVGV